MDAPADDTQHAARNPIAVSALVAYDGTAYRGFQFQANAASIQGALEQALDAFAVRQGRVAGAGRTDAGVHANGQVIGVSVQWRHDLTKLQRAWNVNLPRAISVRTVRKANERFHPRFSAISRTYRYTVWCYAGEPPYYAPKQSPLIDRYAYFTPWPLELAAMQEATSVLVGSHDFSTFGHPPVGENAVRCVQAAAWEVVEESLRPLDPHPGRRLVFTITADAFLHQMVRSLVGSLLAVGSGKWTPQQFVEAFHAQDRSQSAAPAPAHGLVLERVTYPGELDALVHGS